MHGTGLKQTWFSAARNSAFNAKGDYIQSTNDVYNMLLYIISINMESLATCGSAMV